MRRKLVEADLVECVLGLGPNLFYNSPMEACVVICRTQKASTRKGKVLFIDAVKEVARERAQSVLKAEHQARIAATYATFHDVDGFAKVATLTTIAGNDWSLSIPLYVKRVTASASAGSEPQSLKDAWNAWESSGREFWRQMDAVVEMMDGLLKSDAEDV